MNDAQDLFTPEMLERLKSRDVRWRHIDTATKIEAEMQNSVAVQVLMKSFDEDAKFALDELATVDPTDTKKITNLQARVYRARFSHQTLQMCLTRGDDALESLNEDGPVNLEDRIEGEDGQTG